MLLFFFVDQIHVAVIHTHTHICIISITEIRGHFECVLSSKVFRLWRFFFRLP